MKPHDHPNDHLAEEWHFYQKIVFFDEVHFHLGDYINKQNCSILRSENLCVTIEEPIHPQRVVVWCGF